jgi:AcrR family transcriptional regulator
VPEWIPTERSAKGRLTLRALDAFAAHDFEVVNVVELCAAADVTTGTLYHHFGNKLGLYDVVRSEVERRLLDRLEGALAASPGTPSARVHRALLVGFDHLVASGHGRLVSVPHPDAPVDPIEKWLAGALDTGVVPLAELLLAAWRRAVRATVDGVDAGSARAAFGRLSITS